MSETKHERTARIESINLDTGVFSMILATEGEASDGDILSIKGGKVPKRMPMLNGHYNSATEQLGSITDPEKLLEDSPPRLRAMGHIELGGDTGPADVRRDLAYMISQGHVTGMSIRWDVVDGGKPPVRRINLPSDHPYFVDAETEKNPRKRYGLFWPEWRAMEGSVVALGADSKALIGRAEETEGDVSTFWRAMADDLDGRRLEPPDVAITFDRGEEAEGEERYVRVPLPPDESPGAKIAATLAGLRIDAADCREAGASTPDLINAVTDGEHKDKLRKLEPFEWGGGTLFLPPDLIAQIKERLAAGPEPEADEPATSEEMAHILERLDALEALSPTLEEERVIDDPLPSTESERVAEGDPLPPKIADPNEFIDLMIARLKETHGPVPVNDAVVRPHELAELLDRLLGEARERVNQLKRAAIKKARGEVSA